MPINNPEKKKSNDAHAIGAITVDLTPLVEGYNTFMKQEGATEEQGFEGFKNAVIEYISSTADKSKEAWKETLSGLDDGEFRYALKQGYIPLGYDFSFGEDFANGIGAVVENVELDIERLRQSKDGTALQGVSTWLNDNANGYQHLLTDKNALNNALSRPTSLKTMCLKQWNHRSSK